MTGSSVADPDLNALALNRAAILGLPTSAHEDWRYVRCDTLANGEYAPQRSPTSAELRTIVDHTQRALVLFDGRFHSLGHGDWPSEWQLALPTAEDDAQTAARLATETDIAACWAIADGTCRQIVRIAGSHPEPLQVVNVVSGGASGFSLHLEVAPGVTLHVIIRHVALAAARSCPAISITVGRGAQVRVSEFQSTPWHHLLAMATVQIEADATLDWTSVIRGGACVRLGMRALIKQRGAHVALAGLAEVHAQHQAHHWLRVVHAAADSTSDQLFKSVLHDRGRCSFDGCVHILAGADGANATQQNHHLLLSDTTRADTRPQLDIKADDVKANHGATVGQLDADELLYLRMRGLPLNEARALLTVGFSEEVLARLAGVADRAFLPAPETFHPER